VARLKKNAMNQILFTMVDKTDFASPESGITASDFNSAATKKVFGVNHGVSTAFTSATISKAATLVRSAIFQQTLKAAECNFDQIMVVYKHASCADQMLVFDLVDNDDSDIMSAVSDMNSKMLVMSGILSDVYSNLVVNASRALLTQSRVSDTLSMLMVMSGILSDVYSDAVVATSRALLTQSRVSDIQSAIAAGVPLDASTMSDLRSAITGVTATVSASDISDIASAVRATLVSDLSDIYSNLVVNASRALLTQSRVSDIYSLLTAGVPLDASTMSDIRSAISAGPAATVTASDISDIASAVRAALVSDLSDIYSNLVVNASRALLTQSRVSDIYSLMTAGVALDASTMSDIRSAVAGVTATLSASDISDIASAVKATLASDLSDILSAAVQVNSRVLVAQSVLSDVYSNAVVNASRALLTQSRVSDIYSLLSDVGSDVIVMSGILSDVYSNLVVNASRALLTQSRVSDIYALLSDVSSDLGVISGIQSDIYSLLSDVQSAVQGTRIQKNTALANFTFVMVLTSDHVTGATGKTVTATRSIDGAAFGACANAVTEVANGVYAISLAAADLNGDTVMLKMTAADCDATFIEIVTQL